MMFAYARSPCVQTNENMFAFAIDPFFTTSKRNKHLNKITKESMADQDRDLLCASAAFIVIHDLLKLKKLKKKRRGQATLFRNRYLYSGTRLLKELAVDEDSGIFNNFSRMSTEDFRYLLQLVEKKIMKSDTNYRKAIPAIERLAVTLRFLASGDSYTSLMYTFKISKQAISNIVPEVCEAIVEVLQENVKLPQSEDEWLHIAKHFEEVWNFPNCVGSIDGKHILIQAPMNSGSEFFNYKSTFSIVLMAVVDGDYCFRYADVGCQGKISDGGVIRNTTFFKKLQEDTLKLPPNKALPNTDLPLPYVFVADDAFPLQTHILKPYPGVHAKGSIERAFNYRLSRARRVVENVFGIMSSVFRVLRKPMLLEPEKAEKIVLACIHLHNYLRKSKSSRGIYINPGPESQQQSEKQTSLLPIKKVARKSSSANKDNRQHFAEYFANVGRVSWQDLYA